uniref:Uncharacterized protein n=1 Tax=Crocodylus porosus TaxID=8502 RepID=A0A7M4F127_CROPO
MGQVCSLVVCSALTPPRECCLLLRCDADCITGPSTHGLELFGSPYSLSSREQWREIPADLPLQYVVVIPAIIHHPSQEKFCIHLSFLPKTVCLAITPEMKIQNHTLVEKDVEKPDSMFPCIWKAEEVAFVHVLIHSGDTVGFESHKKVLVRDRKEKLLIEMDKPFYKPGETVKFRIVSLDEEFKAIDKVVSVSSLFQEAGASSILPPGTVCAAIITPLPAVSKAREDTVRSL